MRNELQYYLLYSTLFHLKEDAGHDQLNWLPDPTNEFQP